MTKRILSLAVAVCIAFCCVLPAFAAEDAGKISVKLNSNLAGLTAADAEKFIEIKGGNVVYSTHGDGPVSVSDYSGTHVNEALVAGRTYYIDYVLTAADGYTLPDSVSDGEVEIECGDGVRVITSQIVSAREKTDGIFIETFRGLRIYATVKVDGNIFQRIIGFIYDMIIKARAWSLY